MADTFSPNFNFVLPEIGGSADTWGVKLNSNLSDIDTILRRAMPIGGIIMWSGTIANIPAGWALCNGANGTPDLRGRFIAGAGGAYTPGNTGGADSVTLTTTQIPSHTHTTNAAGTHNHGGATQGGGAHSHTTGTAGEHGHSASTGTAGAHTHGIRVFNAANTVNVIRIETGAESGDYATDTATIESAGNHTHTVSINAGGSHTHTVSSVGDHGHGIWDDGSHTHTVNSTGGSGAHENRPPFYALAYIMKVT